MQVVPEGIEAGGQMCVDPDGPEGPLPPMLVTVPEGVGPGDTLQVQIPEVAVAVAVPVETSENPAAAKDID